MHFGLFTSLWMLYSSSYIFLNPVRAHLGIFSHCWMSLPSVQKYVRSRIARISKGQKKERKKKKTERKKPRGRNVSQFLRSDAAFSPSTSFNRFIQPIQPRVEVTKRILHRQIRDTCYASCIDEAIVVNRIAKRRWISSVTEFTFRDLGYENCILPFIFNCVVNKQTIIRTDMDSISVFLALKIISLQWRVYPLKMSLSPIINY